MFLCHSTEIIMTVEPKKAENSAQTVNGMKAESSSTRCLRTLNAFNLGERWF